MAAVETPSRQSASLPPIGYLESEKLKRDEVEKQRSGSNTAMTSPSFPFSGAPGHSHSATANSSGLISPPGSRRTSAEETTPNAPAKLSLPSIHEALGRDPPTLAYPGPPPPPPTSLPPSTSSFFPHPPATSTAEPRRSFAAPEPPPTPYSATSRSPYLGQPPSQSTPMQQPAQPQQATPAPPHSRPEPLSGGPLFPQSKLPAIHPVQSRSSPPAASGRPSLSFPPPQQTPAPYEPSPQSAPANASFGYSGYQSQYSSYPPSTSGVPAYHAPAVMSAPPHHQTPWRSESDLRAEERRRHGRLVQPTYGESVKRHLEQFDYEASLNELYTNSDRVLQFSNVYRERAHQMSRSGPMPGSMPTPQEFQDIEDRLLAIQRAFTRLRDVVSASNAALAERPKDSHPPNGYAPEQNGYPEEQKPQGGFAGADPKKRRGRAAPPGRCHSCNRAETPEWRRGPDGARTLCNACGLHYAKLTRKMGTNKAAIQSSNLRPKNLGGSSPTA